MPTKVLTWKVVLTVVLGLCVLMGTRSPAEAVISIQRAEVVNGVALITGSRAAKDARIAWEGALVTQADRRGTFAFQGVVPADCVGALLEEHAVSVAVALANCVPRVLVPVPQTGQTTSFAAGDDGSLRAGVPCPARALPTTATVRCGTTSRG